MRKTIALWTILLTASSFALAQTKPAPSAKATVTLKKLTEKRELSLEKDAFAGWENGIELSLHVDGPDVVGARKYGKLKAIQGLDDVGTDLTAKGEGPSFAGDTFREVREQQSFGREEKPKPTGFDIDLKLPTPSARSAKSIKVIAGSLEVLVGGEKKIIEVKPIKANLGKTLDDPALKSVGVSVEIVDPAKAKSAAGGFGLGLGPDASKGVTLILSGNYDEIASVSILDASGKKLSHGSMWSDNAKTRTINYGLEQPLPADATMQIEVWPGQKTVVVPFEIKDVKLP